MNTQQTLELLKQLKLGGMMNRYEALLQAPIHEELSAHELIAALAEAEQMHRTHKRTGLYLRTSKLRYTATLEQIHYSTERGLSKDSILELSDCGFIERSENVLITGATGTGKSYLGCALGLRLVCSVTGRCIIP